MQKQSLNNILQKSPTCQQTIIEKHPVNPLILDILIQTIIIQQTENIIAVDRVVRTSMNHETLTPTGFYS